MGQILEDVRGMLIIRSRAGVVPGCSPSGFGKCYTCTERAMVVADMPYGTYHVNEDESVKNALRLMKFGGAEHPKTSLVGEASYKGALGNQSPGTLIPGAINFEKFVFSTGTRFRYETSSVEIWGWIIRRLLHSDCGIRPRARLDTI